MFGGMTWSNPPSTSVRAPRYLVSSADHLATSAGNEMFARGGNAVDAAIATNAAIAVTGPHLCGMGGDLFALVHVDGEVFALNAAGRAGSGADSGAMRDQGLTEMPFKLDIRSVTVPGCVDGWVSLHERFGSLPLDVILAPAQRLAADGFPASPLLAGLLPRLDEASRANLLELVEHATQTGALVRRPGVALALAGVAIGGRDTFYRGAFGDGLIDIGNGLFTESDLGASQAEWVAPIAAEMFGVKVHTVGPSTQGYLTLGSGRLVDQLVSSGLFPDDPEDDHWVHLLIEASTAAGRDRPERLHQDADGDALVAEIAGRGGEIDLEQASNRWAPHRDGDTTSLCTAGRGHDGRMMGVSLIQSNASGLGSHLVEPNTGINLHNRGMGFSLEAGHPGELAPGRIPPHTLSAALATRGSDLVSVFGTMGGDAQPQILLQIATRLFHHGQSPATSINAGRWALKGPQTGFDTWTAASGPRIAVEGHASGAWVEGLAARGHRVEASPEWDSGFGHAHAIVVDVNGSLSGAADPRTVIGSCSGG
jgi:gamma-glutamyltranspeptidase / glutathione hydrolase